MKKNKLPAFTLSELLIVMVISSIVISMAFLVLSMVQKQVSVIQRNMRDQQKIQFLERLLWKDFNQYQIRFNNTTQTLECANLQDTIHYLFTNRAVIRENDTIMIALTNKKLFLDGQEVQKGFVDGIELQTTQSYSNRKLFVYKPKDASFYLNQ